MRNHRLQRCSVWQSNSEADFTLNMKRWHVYFKHLHFGRSKWFGSSLFFFYTSILWDTVGTGIRVLFLLLLLQTPHDQAWSRALCFRCRCELWHSGPFFPPPFLQLESPVTASPLPLWSPPRPPPDSPNPECMDRSMSSVYTENEHELYNRLRVAALPRLLGRSPPEVCCSLRNEVGGGLEGGIKYRAHRDRCTSHKLFQDSAIQVSFLFYSPPPFPWKPNKAVGRKRRKLSVSLRLKREKSQPSRAEEREGGSPRLVKKQRKRFVTNRQRKAGLSLTALTTWKCRNFEWSITASYLFAYWERERVF